VKEEAYERLRLAYLEKRDSIGARLREFKDVFKNGDDRRVFEELAFCILTSAVGPKVGLLSLGSIRDVLMEGGEDELYRRLLGVHKYPEKAGFIVETREYLKREFDFKLKDLILSFKDPMERRDFFALNRNIRGIGYLQASHFLRNIGFSGYAILDKNVILSLYNLGVIENPRPPTTRNRYLEVEERLKGLAEDLGIGFDELDLLLWSERTGHIPR
jgi:N-glycosylase/DNA lyase